MLEKSNGFEGRTLQEFQSHEKRLRCVASQALDLFSSSRHFQSQVQVPCMYCADMLTSDIAAARVGLEPGP